MKRLGTISLLMAVMTDPHLLEDAVNSQPSTSWLNRMRLRLEKSMKTLAGDRSAFAAMLIMGVMAIIVGSALLYVGLYVSVTIAGSIPPVADAAYNTSLTNIKSNVNTAFTVLGLALLVGGFGVVIYVLRTGFVSGDVR